MSVKIRYIYYDSVRINVYKCESGLEIEYEDEL